MIVVFYKSGQEPGAVKVCVYGGGGIYSKSNLYWERFKWQAAPARPPATPWLPDKGGKWAKGENEPVDF